MSPGVTLLLATTLGFIFFVVPTAMLCRALWTLGWLGRVGAALFVAWLVAVALAVFDQGLASSKIEYRLIAYFAIWFASLPIAVSLMAIVAWLARKLLVTPSRAVSRHLTAQRVVDAVHPEAPSHPRPDA